MLASLTTPSSPPEIQTTGSDPALQRFLLATTSAKSNEQLRLSYRRKPSPCCGACWSGEMGATSRRTEQTNWQLPTPLAGPELPMVGGSTAGLGSDRVHAPIA